MTDKQPKPSQQEVADAIAYFRATSNRRDLTDILTAALGGEPEPATTDPQKPSLAQKLNLKK